MRDYFILHAAPALVNLILLLENLRRDHPFHRILSFFYLFMALTNAVTMFELISGSATSATVWFIAGRHLALAFPGILTMLAAFISGRNLFDSGVLMVAGIDIVSIIVSDVMLPSGQDPFIGTLREFPFGQFITVSASGFALLAGNHAVGFVVSMLYLFKPKKWSSFWSRRAILPFFFTWWAAVFSTVCLTLLGYPVPPIGLAFDGVLSLVLCFALTQHALASANLLIKAARLVSALSLGLACAFMMSFLFVGQIGSLGLVAIGSGAALLCHEILRPHISPDLRQSDLQLAELGLSRQEIRICELLHEGQTRTSLLLFLNVSSGTLRNHLQSIYRKVLKSLPSESVQARDQLQRLTVFLHQRMEKPGNS